jgi:predicted permease
VGLAVSTVTFHVADAILFRPLPFPNAHELTLVWQSDRQRNQPFIELSYPVLREWRDKAKLASIAGMGSVNNEVVLAGRDEPVAIEGRWVTGNFFEVLGITPLLGRALAREDDEPGRSRVIVLSHGLWRDHFGADADIIGTSANFDGQTHTIVGVMPPSFDYPKNARFWVPVAPTAPRLVNERNLMWMIALGRLKGNVQPEAARGELSSLWLRFYEGPDDSGYAAVLTPFAEGVYGRTRAALWATATTIALLFLLTSLNVTALQVLRVSERRNELAVRHALGATRTRLFKGVCAELMVLTAIGCAIAMLMTAVVTPILMLGLPPEIPRLDLEAVITLRTIGFATAAAGLAAVLCGIGSATVISRVSPDHTDLRTTSRRNELRTVLTVAQVAVAVMLSVAAVLAARSYNNLASVPLGFDTESIVAVRVSPQGDMTRNRSLYRDLLERVQQLPGVEDVAAVTQRPLWSTVGNDWVFMIEGQSERDAERNPMVNLMAISSEYFRTMGIRVMHGRPLDEKDVQGQPGSVVISESLAQHLWPDRDAVGQRIKLPLGNSPYHNTWMTVVGVVGDARYRELHATRFDLYLSPDQADHRLNHLLIRSHREAAALIPQVRAIVRELDRNLPVTDVITMKQAVSQALSIPAFTAASLTVFAAFAAGLAGLGLYGLLASTVAARTREIGIRMAMGAIPANLIYRFLREGLLLTLIGAALGLAGAFALAELVSAVVFGVSVRDPLNFALAVLFLTIVASVATILPARRAARVDPLVALRYE